MTGRVGVAAEKRMYYHQNISVLPSLEENKIEEELAPVCNYMLYNEHGDIINDIPMEIYDHDLVNSGCDDTSNFSVNDICLDSFHDEQGVKKECKNLGNGAAEMKTSLIDEDIVVTKVIKNKKTMRSKKKRLLKFSKEEEWIIRGNRMLTDESINIAQNLLAEKFPQYEGFQDTVLGNAQSYNVIRQNSKYIQILNSASKCHWVCVANTNSTKSSNEQHYIYDSLSGKHISSDIISQIASYSYHPDSQLVLHVTSVQQQNNGVDCGVYAIAFATSLVYGFDPEKIHLDNSLMLVTALSPIIGYDNAARIAKKALKNKTTLKAEALKSGLIKENEYDKIVDPQKMIRPL